MFFTNAWYNPPKPSVLMVMIWNCQFGGAVLGVSGDITPVAVHEVPPYQTTFSILGPETPSVVLNDLHEPNSVQFPFSQLLLGLRKQTGFSTAVAVHWVSPWETSFPTVSLQTLPVHLKNPIEPINVQFPCSWLLWNLS